MIQLEEQQWLVDLPPAKEIVRNGMLEIYAKAIEQANGDDFAYLLVRNTTWHPDALSIRNKKCVQERNLLQNAAIDTFWAPCFRSFPNENEYKDLPDGHVANIAVATYKGKPILVPLFMSQQLQLGYSLNMSQFQFVPAVDYPREYWISVVKHGSTFYSTQPICSGVFVEQLKKYHLCD